MNLQINKDVLVNALSKVEKAVGKSTKPVLQGVYLEVTDSKLKFVGSNDEQTITVELNVDETITVKEPGKIVLSKDTLTIIKKLRKDAVSIVVSDLQYTVSAGTSKFDFVGFDPEAFPIFSEPTTEPILEFTFEELKSVADKLAFAASTEENRPVLQGIQIEGKAGTNQLRMVSTNSYMLSQKVIAKEVKEDVSILPKARSVIEVLKVFNVSDTIKIYSTPSNLVFKSDEVTVFARVLEGNYPDTSRLIMKDFKAIIEIDKDEFLYALEQVQIVGHSDAKQNTAMLSLAGINLKLENSTIGSGKANIEIPLVELQTNEEIEIKFAFDVKYMINLIRATDGNIKLGYIGPMLPISILGTESTSAEYKLLLPIRIHQ